MIARHSVALLVAGTAAIISGRQRRRRSSSTLPNSGCKSILSFRTPLFGNFFGGLGVGHRDSGTG